LEEQLLRDTAATLQKTFGPPPSTVIVLGSGLGLVSGLAANAKAVPYGELGLPITGIVGHAGALLVGEHAGRRVAFLSGRVHHYEGRAPEELVRAVRAVALWGARRFVLTNAVGGIHPDLRIGELVLVEDHINLTGANPLRGPNLNTDGARPRFPDLNNLYDAQLRAEAAEAARGLGLRLHSGVYAAMAGPSYETPAEIRMLQVMGAKVVGMSLVHEAIALRHLGVPLIGVSMVSNLAAGLTEEPPNHEDVTRAVALAAGDLRALLGACVGRWS
jgi:purine-nucleoside phosphorylase